MPIPERALRRELGSFSTDRFGSFVADLWRARGRAVDPPGGPLLVVEARAGDDRRLYVLAGDDSPDVLEDVDVVAHASDPPPDVAGNVDTVGPGDFHRILNYAIEDEDRSRLIGTYFEYESAGSAGAGETGARTIDSDVRAADGSGEDADGPAHVPEIESPLVTPSPGEAGEDELSPLDLYDPGRSAERDETGTEVGTADREPARWSRAGTADVPVNRRQALIGAGLVMGSGAVLAAALDTDATGAGDPAARSGGRPGSGSGSGDSADSGGSDAGSDAVMVAPGVSTEGVVDPDALAGAQANFLLNDRYSFVDRHEVHDDGSLLSGRTVRLELGEDRSYHARLTVGGPEAPDAFGDPPVTAQYYSEGERVYVSHSPSGDGEFLALDSRSSGLSWDHWALAVPYRWHHGGVRSFYSTLFRSTPTRFVGRGMDDADSDSRLVNERDRPRGTREPFERWRDVSRVRDLTLVAELDEATPIQALSIEHLADAERGTLSVRRNLEYGDVGRPRVERPEWFDRARESTARER